MDLLGEDLLEEMVIVFPKEGEARLYANKPDNWTPEMIAHIAQHGITAIVSWARLFGVMISGTLGPPPGMPVGAPIIVPGQPPP